MKCFTAAIFVFSISGSFSYSQSIKEGVKFLNEEQYPNAKKVFNQLLKSNPKDAEAWYYAGEVYLQMENTDSAKTCFASGIAANADFALNYLGMGKVVLPADYAEGRKNFDKAIQLNKKDPNVYVEIASYFINSDQKDLTQAKIFLDKAFKADENNPAYYLANGDYYWAQNDGSKALAEYDKAMNLNKNLPETYLKIGKLYSRARNYDLALDYYKKGLAIDSSYGAFYREIGELYYKAKKYDKAIDYYKKYVQKTGESKETLFRYASFLFINNDYASTIQLLDKLSKESSVNPVTYRLLGYSYYETKDYTKGLQNMDLLFAKLDPKKLIASDYEYYGKLQLKQGNDSLALLNITKAITMDTSNASLYSELGNIYYSKKKYKEASEEYSEKVKRKGATLQDYLNLGKAYYFNKDYKPADSVFTKLIELKPSLSQAYLWRARASSMLDPDSKEGLALPFYEKFAQLAGTEKEKNKSELIESYSYLGYYYLLRKDNNNAINSWKKVKELDPSNKKAEDALKILTKK